MALIELISEREALLLNIKITLLLEFKAYPSKGYLLCVFPYKEDAVK